MSAKLIRCRDSTGRLTVAKSNKLILGHCIYDPGTRTICNKNHSPQVIGHVQAKLLEKLYRSPSVYFSNADLQRDVWDNRFIEKITIRTTVSYLRKALGESEDCRYIESGRNKGYRFIAHIEEISPTRRLKRFLPTTVTAIILALITYIIFKADTPVIVPEMQTTLLGQEFQATVNDNLLVFSHKSPGNQYWNLYSKRLGQERYFQLTDGQFDDSHATFSPDGKKIAFNRHDGDTCKIIIANVERERVELAEPEVVFDCFAELLSVSIAWKDKNNLYLSYIESRSTPYRIYSYNIETKKLTPITSPSATSMGDYYVTKSFESKKVAFFRLISRSKTEVWIYDEQIKDFTKIASVPHLLNTAAWTDAGNKLIIQTGNQLNFLNIENGELKSLFAANYPISYPFTVNNKKIGFMRGSRKVKDIIQLTPDGNRENLITSSFNDYRPVYAQSSGDIAFISNRTGRTQIWLRQKNGELNQLTKFDESFRITDLAISSNGERIAFIINAQLHIISRNGELIFSSSKGRIYKNPAFSNDNQSIYYSLLKKDLWFIESRSFDDFTATPLTDGYVVKPCYQGNCFYFTKFDDNLLYKSTNGAFESTGASVGDILSPNQIEVINDSVYYIGPNKRELLHQSIKTRKITSVTPLSSSHFSIEANPLRFFTSAPRESETNLEVIELFNQ